MPLSSLTFALDASGRTVHVDDVANGLACNCICRECGERLIAKQGSTAHHFAHESGAECATAIESALHMAAKAVLERERRVAVPAPSAIGSAYDSMQREHQATCSLPSATIVLDAVVLEIKLDGNKPDILATVGEKQLIIEIAVTSFAGEEKVRRLAAQGIAAIEIDLSGIDRQADWTSITAAVIDRISNKRWLFNPRQAALQTRANRDAQELADQADREADAIRNRVDYTHEYERAHTAGYQEELARFREFIAPEKQAALRAQVAPDGENEDAWQSAVADLGAQWDDPPAHINISVAGELAFVVDRRVWQAGIFVTFLRRNPHKSFTSEDVVKWAFKCFERRVAFPILAKNKHLLPRETWQIFHLVSSPVTNYLQALAEMGFIEAKRNRYLTDKKRWRILKWG